MRIEIWTTNQQHHSRMELGLRLMNRVLASWMAGSLRGAWLNMRGGLNEYQHEVEKDAFRAVVEETSQARIAALIASPRSLSSGESQSDLESALSVTKAALDKSNTRMEAAKAAGDAKLKSAAFRQLQQIMVRLAKGETMMRIEVWRSKQKLATFLELQNRIDDLNMEALLDSSTEEDRLANAALCESHQDLQTELSLTKASLAKALDKATTEAQVAQARLQASRTANAAMRTAVGDVSRVLQYDQVASDLVAKAASASHLKVSARLEACEDNRLALQRKLRDALQQGQQTAARQDGDQAQKVTAMQQLRRTLRHVTLSEVSKRFVRWHTNAAQEAAGDKWRGKLHDFEGKVTNRLHAVKTQTDAVHAKARTDLMLQGHRIGVKQLRLIFRRCLLFGMRKAIQNWRDTAGILNEFWEDLFSPVPTPAAKVTQLPTFGKQLSPPSVPEVLQAAKIDGLTQTEAVKVNEAFLKMDVDGDGVVSYEEFTSTLQQDEDLSEIFSRGIISTKGKRELNLKEMSRLWHMIDKDLDDGLTLEEMKALWIEAESDLKVPETEACLPPVSRLL